MVSPASHSRASLASHAPAGRHLRMASREVSAFDHAASRDAQLPPSLSSNAFAAQLRWTHLRSSGLFHIRLPRTSGTFYLRYGYQDGEFPQVSANRQSVGNSCRLTLDVPRRASMAGFQSWSVICHWQSRERMLGIQKPNSANMALFFPEWGMSVGRQGALSLLFPSSGHLRMEAGLLREDAPMSVRYQDLQSDHPDYRFSSNVYPGFVQSRGLAVLFSV